jgi:DNA processing protein
MLNETMYRIALQYQENFGNQLIKKLIQNCGSAENLFANSPDLLFKKQYLGKSVPRPLLTDKICLLVEKEYEWMQKNEIKLCFFLDDNYPKRLKNCNDFPFMFYYKGDDFFNRSKVIAVVGTRNASDYGCEIVKKIISEIAGYDISVVSGLAMGIDTMAHEQSLAFGLNTVAVLGSGLGVIYPAFNKKLANRIVDYGGTIISEFPHDMIPDRNNFPRRNRIIAGMSDATIVVETAKKGGSVITAYLAHSYNRDVFAVPGSVFNPLQDGCHELIRCNIASLLNSGEHLIEMMGWNSEPPKSVQRELFIELDEKEKKIWEIIRMHQDISIDEIIQCCNELTPSKVAGILLGLELKGAVECKPGKIYRI